MGLKTCKGLMISYFIYTATMINRNSFTANLGNF